MTTPGRGRWQVTTETSVYLIDLDAGRIIRVPDAGTGRAPAMTPTALASLRRDHERIELIHLYICEVGRPMKLVLQIRADGVETVRTTTIVRDIRRLDAD